MAKITKDFDDRTKALIQKLNSEVCTLIDPLSTVTMQSKIASIEKILQDATESTSSNPTSEAAQKITNILNDTQLNFFATINSNIQNAIDSYLQDISKYNPA